MVGIHCRPRFGKLSPKAAQRPALSEEMTSPSVTAPPYSSETRSVSARSPPTKMRTCAASWVKAVGPRDLPDPAHLEVDQVEHERVGRPQALNRQRGEAADRRAGVGQVDGEVVVDDVEGFLLRACRTGGEEKREGQAWAHGVSGVEGTDCR